MTETVVITETVAPTVITVSGQQGPPGPQGNHGFQTSVDVIDGGTPSTDYTTGFVFDGGAP